MLGVNYVINGCFSPMKYIIAVITQNRVIMAIWKDK